MGLDSVELVLAVEERFGIEIPDGAASAIVTVGDLHSFIVNELRRLGHDHVDDDWVFKELRKLISYEQAIKLELIVPEARIVQDLGID